MFRQSSISNLLAAGTSHFSAPICKTLTAEALTAETWASHLDSPMDSDEFAAFYERSARPLWAYLARVSGNPALADDLMQESYVRFLTAARPPRLQDGEVASRKYLFRIASNLLKDHWRSPGSSCTRSFEDVGADMLVSPDNGHQDGVTTSVNRALALLKPRERQLLWLAHAEEYSHREIAEITGLSSASIRLLLFRARRHAARLLTEPHGFDSSKTQAGLLSRSGKP